MGCHHPVSVSTFPGKGQFISPPGVRSEWSCGKNNTHRQGGLRQGATPSSSLPPKTGPGPSPFDTAAPSPASCEVLHGAAEIVMGDIRRDRRDMVRDAAN